MRQLPRSAFTLLELLVVIAIIGILVALLLPAVQQAREAMRRTECANNLKQIALSLDTYEDTKKVYPPGRLGCDGINYGPCANDPDYKRVGTSGFVMLLPFLEQQPLYDLFDFRNGPWLTTDIDNNPAGSWWQSNGPAVSVRPSVMVCPSDSLTDPYIATQGYRPATGSYALNMGSRGPTYGIDSRRVKIENNGVFMYKVAHRRSEITDGLSHTMFLGETIDGHLRESRNFWTQGGRHLSSLRTTDNPLNTPTGSGITVDLYGYSTNGCFASRHIRGANFAFGDGHVVFLDENIDLLTYRALSTRDEADTAIGGY